MSKKRKIGFHTEAEAAAYVRGLEHVNDSAIHGAKVVHYDHYVGSWAVEFEDDDYENEPEWTGADGVENMPVYDAGPANPIEELYIQIREGIYLADHLGDVGDQTENIRALLELFLQVHKDPEMARWATLVRPNCWELKRESEGYALDEDGHWIEKTKTPEASAPSETYWIIQRYYRDRWQTYCAAGEVEWVHDEGYFEDSRFSTRAAAEGRLLAIKDSADYRHYNFPYRIWEMHT